MSKYAETIARKFHETYEELAPHHGYETRKESAVPWDQVPEQNRSLMVDVVDALLNEGVIEEGVSAGRPEPMKCPCCKAYRWECVCWGGAFTDAHGNTTYRNCTPADHGRDNA